MVCIPALPSYLDLNGLLSKPMCLVGVRCRHVVRHHTDVNALDLQDKAGLFWERPGDQPDAVRIHPIPNEDPELWRRHVFF